MLRLSSNLRSSCLSLPSTEFTSMRDHTWRLNHISDSTLQNNDLQSHTPVHRCTGLEENIKNQNDEGALGNIPRKFLADCRYHKENRKQYGSNTKDRNIPLARTIHVSSQCEHQMLFN